PYYSSSNGGAANCTAPGDTFQFDALGRPTQTTHSDNSVFLTSYAGRSTETQDEGNPTARVTRITQRDGLGRLGAVCEVSSTLQLGTDGAPASCGLDIGATGFLTTYQHDALGNLLQVNQGAAQRSFAYDGRSRLISATTPESGTTMYSWDEPPPGGYCAGQQVPGSSGDIVQRMDARGISTCYRYDPLHRITWKNYSDGTPVRFYAYDMSTAWVGVALGNPIGRLTYASTPAVAEVFGYDATGRTTRNWQALANGSTYPLDYAYDLAGDLTTAANGAGVTLASTYDLAGRPQSLSSSLVDPQHPATLASGVQYNAFKEPVAITMGNGIAETTQFDARGRMIARSAGSIYSLSGIQYANDGDVIAAADSANGGAWSYRYDDLNRLSAATAPAIGLGFAFDRRGNRWQQSVTAGAGPSFSQAFDGNNHAVGYSYDAAGNLVADGHCTYTYDAENELTSVGGGGCIAATYIYDAEGRRVRTVTGSTEDTVFDLEGRPAAVFGMVNGSPQWWWSEIYLG
ncbi:MAG: hypothetical protein ACRD1E_02115, partial [Terriglobales bacterium]